MYIESMFRYLKKVRDTVSDKDNAAIDSMKKQFLEKGHLSQKQVAYLSGIENKYRAYDDSYGNEWREGHPLDFGDS